MKKLQMYRLILAIISFLASFLSFLAVRNTVEVNWKIIYLVFGIVFSMLELTTLCFFLREFIHGSTSASPGKERKRIIVNDANKAIYFPTLDATTRGCFDFFGGTTYPDKGQIVYIHNGNVGLPLYSGFIGYTAKEVAYISELDFQNMLHTLGLKKN